MKLIHCADLHLDSPMETHMSARQASTRNTELIRSFVHLTEYAKTNGVRAVLIAGDLFDGDRVRARTVDEILDAMERAPEVDYLYLAGNHDEAARAFSDRALPRNLRRFTRQWSTFTYDGVAVSGIELCGENAQTLYEQIPCVEGCINLVMLHGQTGAACTPEQINLNRLKDRGIDYLALGHIHSYSAWPLDSRGVCCYAGCLEGRGFDECGEKGFVLLTAENGRLRHEFVPFSCRTLHRLPVDITGLDKSSQVGQRMREAARDIPEQDMVEFLLTGHSAPTADISLTYLQDQINSRFFFTRVKDESHMAIDPEAYQNDVSLKGEFIRLVLGSDAEEEQKAAMIRAGLQALAGEEITI